MKEHALKINMFIMDQERLLILIVLGEIALLDTCRNFIRHMS